MGPGNSTVLSTVVPEIAGDPASRQAKAYPAGEPPEKFICDAKGLKFDTQAPSPWAQKYRLKLLQNLYGLKDAGATWFNHLTNV